MILSIAKIGALVTAKYITIMVVGQITTAVFFSISILLIFFGETSLGSQPALGHVSGNAALAIIILNLFVYAPWPSSAIALNIFVFTPLYVYLAGSISSKTALKKLWDGGLQGFISRKITAYITQSPHLNESSNIKKTLVKLTKIDPENTRWQKKIITYCIKKLPLGDIDWSLDANNISSEVNIIFNNFMSELLEVKHYYFYLTWLTQVAVSIFLLTR